MKVLLTTDGSNDAHTALVTASRLLIPSGIGLLCVTPELSLTPGKDESQHRPHRKRYTDRMSAWGKRVLREGGVVLEPEGIHPNTMLKSGSPADVILRTAADYDLVVVGAHGRTERTQPGLGPVASRIVEHVSCSVLVGRPLVNEDSYRVLVAVDGSDASLNALRILAAGFKVASADVTLIHIVELPWMRLEEETETEDLTDDQRHLEAELRIEADSTVDQARRLLESAGLSTTEIITEGIPSLEILSHAEEGDYDLIVVGATGFSDLKHALLGSVSVRIAWNAPCSVAVIRT